MLFLRAGSRRNGSSSAGPAELSLRLSLPIMPSLLMKTRSGVSGTVTGHVVLSYTDWTINYLGRS